MRVRLVHGHRGGAWGVTIHAGACDGAAASGATVSFTINGDPPLRR